MHIVHWEGGAPPHQLGGCASTPYTHSSYWGAPQHCARRPPTRSMLKQGMHQSIVESFPTQNRSVDCCDSSSTEAIFNLEQSRVLGKVLFGNIIKTKNGADSHSHSIKSPKLHR